MQCVNEVGLRTYIPYSSCSYSLRRKGVKCQLFLVSEKRKVLNVLMTEKDRNSRSTYSKFVRVLLSNSNTLFKSTTESIFSGVQAGRWRNAS